MKIRKVCAFCVHLYDGEEGYSCELEDYTPVDLFFYRECDKWKFDEYFIDELTGYEVKDSL